MKDTTKDSAAQGLTSAVRVAGDDEKQELCSWPVVVQSHTMFDNVCERRLKLKT